MNALIPCIPGLEKASDGITARHAHGCPAKYGCQATCYTAAAVGTTNALHDELRAVTRRRSRAAAEADDEEDYEVGAAEADGPPEEDTGKLCQQIDLEGVGTLTTSTCTCVHATTLQHGFQV